MTKSKKKTRQVEEQGPELRDYALSGGRYAMHDRAHAEFNYRKVSGRPEEKQVRTAILARWPDLLEPKGGEESGEKDKARGVRGGSGNGSQRRRSVAGQRGGHNRGRRKKGKSGSGSPKPKAGAGDWGQATETA